VDIGGTRRVITYSCSSSSDQGELSGGAAGGLGIAIGAGLILIAGGPVLQNIGPRIPHRSPPPNFKAEPLRDYTQKPPPKEPIFDLFAGKWMTYLCDCPKEGRHGKKCKTCGTRFGSFHKVCRDCGFQGWDKEMENRRQGMTKPIHGDCPECGSGNYFACPLTLTSGSLIHCSECIGPGNGNWVDVPVKEDSPYGWGMSERWQGLTDDEWRSRTCFKQSGLPPPPPRQPKPSRSEQSSD